ncbi:MAG: CoB--CoM heterodisulfide reductase iron-sulfur subunit A family protein, partial [Nitrospinota bacterium]|nr:CoB--CoM heterodisulfide reductase iron-sulfur subunit A family protein [Nitrospinota bacterium]
MNDNILVIGGGVAGMTAALEAAEMGRKVTLVEREPYLGGRVIRMAKYFPKLCPPGCGTEINFRRLRANPRVTIMVDSQVASITGARGDFTATIKTRPRYVNEKCTACGDCEKVCPVERSDSYNYGMKNTKAIYLADALAMPFRHSIDMSVCKGADCGECVKVCKYEAIDLAMEEKTTTITASAVVHATGWKPYDASRIENLGYGQIKNVINNVEMERLASVSGPTEGRILRRDNGEPPSVVAMVQCAGSRDENHLPYCSSICCLVSIKHANYVREQYPDSDVYVFYIDLRAPGKYESFYRKAMEDPKIHFIKGKVARIEEDESGRAVVTAEDIIGGGKTRVACDLVVLATGMEPESKSVAPLMAKINPDGFILEELQGDAGLIACGVASGPFDVTTSTQNSTAAALK